MNGELIVAFVNDFPKECQGVLEYLRLADICEENGYTDEKQILLQMAVDEYTHAREIIDYLTANSVPLTDSNKELWTDAVSKLQKHGYLN